MITTKTVFILGAGASNPFGLPIGSQLTREIQKSLDPANESETNFINVNKINPNFHGGIPVSNNRFIRLLNKLGHDDEEIDAFRKCLSRMDLNSIDAFLEHRTEFIPIGKIAIAYNLLKHENEEMLFKNPDWYKYIWNIMNCPFEEFDKNKIAFITFNYDRTLEYYFIDKMHHLYRKPYSECNEQLKKLKIVHVHGKIGDLPWENPNKCIEFGEKINDPEKLKYAKDSIKIIHDKFEDMTGFEEAFDLLSSAKNIYFLGFGYSKTNMERLGIHKLSSVIKGTGKGMTRNEHSMVTNIFRNVRMESTGTFDCLKFIREHVTLN